MSRLSNLYTRTGDDGSTALADGRRIPKDHPRIEALGELDHLNAQLGLLLAELNEALARWPALQELLTALAPCQHRLFDLGGELAMPAYQCLTRQDTQQLEQWIDEWTARLGPLENFILPGGSRLVAQAHLCRSVARTAERRLQQLNAQQALRAECLAYLNRLSDLLFAAARLIAQHQGCPEVLWQEAQRPTL